ncbi:ABC transporter substrate-binding protein [Williamsia maris]|uniref:Branched-chain amino acid transport system substrate-binding protein n=1 Tax=Williamsia maris TaxID=72806 RepID=A0ABT1HBI4_9NOCA|nr:ABC transporter substrate-binding protein [Williamsia maris]MCP2175524.1 branched-chain amino acid transport system substrate-binding protein [Williamsia maris]
MLGATGVLAVGGVAACADDSTSSSSDASAASTSSLPSNAATGEAIKVGYITPEGGAVSLAMVREGGEAAANYLNNNGGGIGGHKIDLAVCKEQEEPASATKCANEMVEKKVSVVVSPASSQGAVMVPIITRAGIPYVSQAPVSQVEMVSPNSFMLSGGVISVLSGQAVTAAKAGLKKVTVLVGDAGDAPASIRALGTPIFKGAGVDLDVVSIPTSAADPTPQITAGLSGNPGAVSILGDQRQCISVLKALQTVAPQVKKYLISACLDKPVVAAVGAQTIAGAKAFTTVNTGSDDPSVTLYRSIMARYAPDTDPAGIAYLGYQTVMALGEVGKSLQNPVTAQSFITAFSGAKNVSLPAAPGIAFTCDSSAVPQLRALCSKAILVSDVTSDSTLENTVAVNN